MTLHWSAAQELTKTLVTGYIVEQSQGLASEDFKVLSVVNPAARELDIQNLVPESITRLRVRALTRNQPGAYSQALVVVTPSEPVNRWTEVYIYIYLFIDIHLYSHIFIDIHIYSHTIIHRLIYIYIHRCIGDKDKNEEKQLEGDLWIHLRLNSSVLFPVPDGDTRWFIFKDFCISLVDVKSAMSVNEVSAQLV